MDKKRWDFYRFELRMAVFMAVLSLFHQNPVQCLSLNSEGLALLNFREKLVRDPYGALSNWDGNSGGDIDPCSWFGVECSDGKVVVLNLKDLCLEGILAPELRNLAGLKSIILRNNSFHGSIPKEIGELKELEVLDLGYNNFSGPFPSDFGNNLSLTALLLDNNKFLGSISPELNELKMLSEFQVDENQLADAALRPSCNSMPMAWIFRHLGDSTYRRLLQVAEAPNSLQANNDKGHERGSTPSPSPSSSLPPNSASQSPFSPTISPSNSPLSSPRLSSFSPSPSPLESPLSSQSTSTSRSSIFLIPSSSPILAPSPAASTPANPPTIYTTLPKPGPALEPSPANPTQNLSKHSKTRHHVVLILAGTIVGSLFLFIMAMGIIFSRSSKVVTVRPWATGLSGQLQKAFVTGVPKLKRSELEAACEDFSNIIGNFSDGTIYKGTLSSGVEIAVTSSTVKSREDWSKNLEAQFRKKIDTLSKINHKNFVNLIGYCEEEVPFTRMMVFEYAPNGTLFEHLHIKEAEHLDWETRVRVAMGMAYCLDHMHRLTPPIAHKNLHSSSICLSEDYAAKISDFSFWNEVTAAKMGSAGTELLETPSADPDSNIYSFGLILFEIITGRMPYSMDSSLLMDRASGCLRGDRPWREFVDPTLKSFQENVLDRLLEVVQSCIHPDPKQRPKMTQIADTLKDITSMGPDGATPKLSPLWWAELEITATEGS